MYNSDMFNGIFAFFVFMGFLLGAVLVGAAWAFLVYVWPWLRAWLHAVTA